MLLKTIDRYILKKFIGTFIFSIMLIISIVIIFDISEKIDNFIHASLHEIVFDHYLNFIPFFTNQLSPLFTFISVIFFTSKMATRYETVAILSSGITYKRFLRPYVIGATGIALTSLYLSHFVIPKANRHRQAFEDKYINQHYQTQERNIHRQLDNKNNGQTLIYMESYANLDNRGNRFTIEKIKNFRQYYMLSADWIEWDTLKKKWIAHNYYERIEHDDSLQKNSTKRYSEQLKFGQVKELDINFKPADMGRIESKVEVMTYPELRKFIAEEREKGSSGMERFEVENYKRTAFPFSTFILTIIGVCISSRRVRGGIGLHLAIGLLLAASYMMFFQVSSIFAITNILTPFIAVWIPNIVYSGIAFYLYRTAQK